MTPTLICSWASRAAAPKVAMPAVMACLREKFICIAYRTAAKRVPHPRKMGSADVSVSAFSVLPSAAQSYRLRRGRLPGTGPGSAVRPARVGPPSPGSVRTQPRGADRLVHAGAGRPAHPAAAGPLACSCHPRASHLRRVQFPAVGRHARALSSAQPHASDACLLRGTLRPAGAALRLHLSDRTGARTGYRPIAVRASMGRRRTEHRGSLCALLLDAARLDHSRLGAVRRPAGGDRVRSAVPLDERILGRRRFGNCRMPVFGALPRLAVTPRRQAVLLGTGLGLQMLTRPFEFLFLATSTAVFLFSLRRAWRQWAPAAVLAMMPAAGLVLLHNHAVTGNWTTLPYMLSRYQYGVPTTLTFERIPTPHHPLNQEQRVDYELQSDIHGRAPETPARYPGRLGDRVRFYRFFLLAPLYVALPAFLLKLREGRSARVALCLLLFALGANFYPYFYPHYIAAAACLFLLVAVISLDRMGVDAGRAIAVLCFAHFLFWYGLHLFGEERMWKFEPWDSIEHGDPDGRIAIERRLRQEAGRQLVFVRYGPKHLLEEWVHNSADPDRAPIVWANDLGAEENVKLSRYYPDRKLWLLEPDSTPPKLTPYR